jgi:hypothetical protein
VGKETTNNCDAYRADGRWTCEFCSAQWVMIYLIPLTHSQPKCERYWPENINDNWDVGCNLRVCLFEQRPFAEYTVKILLVTDVSAEF